MKKATFVATALAPLLASNAMAASELEVAISSDMVSADYRMTDESRGSQWGVGALYNEEHDASAVSAVFNVVGDTFALDQVRAGLGVKGIVHDTFQTAASVAVGGFARYEPQFLAGIGVEGEAYYAPEILNTNDADRYYELVARVTYDVHSRAKVFAGYANKTVEYDGRTDVELNDNLNLGFTLSF